MKSYLLRTVALSALMTGPSLAADMAVKAPVAPASPLYNWSGFYAGLNAGAGFVNSDPNTSASCVPSGAALSLIICADVPNVNAAGTGPMSHTGFTGGGQLGYNWQRNALVLGAEVDVKSFSAGASRTGVSMGTNGTYTVSNSANTHWLTTVRGRAGWAVNNLLFYGTGGLAVTDLRASNSLVTDYQTGSGSWGASTTKAGWVAGAGVEWGVVRNWTLRAEYLYVHFSPITANGVVASSAAFGYGSAISTSTDLSAHIARAGINYRF